MAQTAAQHVALLLAGFECAAKQVPLTDAPQYPMQFWFARDTHSLSHDPLQQVGSSTQTDVQQVALLQPPVPWVVRHDWVEVQTCASARPVVRRTTQAASAAVFERMRMSRIEVGRNAGFRGRANATRSNH